MTNFVKRSVRKESIREVDHRRNKAVIISVLIIISKGNFQKEKKHKSHMISWSQWSQWLQPYFFNINCSFFFLCLPTRYKAYTSAFGFKNFSIALSRDILFWWGRGPTLPRSDSVGCVFFRSIKCNQICITNYYELIRDKPRRHLLTGKLNFISTWLHKFILFRSSFPVK